MKTLNPYKVYSSSNNSEFIECNITMLCDFAKYFLEHKIGDIIIDTIECSEPPSFNIYEFIHFLCFYCDSEASYAFKTSLSSYAQIFTLLNDAVGDEFEIEIARNQIFSIILGQTEEMLELMNNHKDLL